jgi:hypothetical protein
MQTVGVECQFRADGRVMVRRIRLDGQWLPVEQGRQWVDPEGRHVLIMRPGRPAEELLLRKETMTWGLRPLGQTPQLV